MNRALSNNLVLILHKSWVDHDGPAAHTLSTYTSRRFMAIQRIAALFKRELLKETKREPSRSAEVRQLAFTKS